MSKKKTGLLIALGAVAGVAAAGISYYLKYKSFNDEIDKDFHDYEEEDFSELKTDEPVSFTETNRTYITLDGNKSKADTTAVVSEDAVPAAEAATETTEETANVTSDAATVEEDTEGTN